MTKLLMLLMTLGFLASCQDYVSEKREGMKRFNADEDTREAQEE